MRRFFTLLCLAACFALTACGGSHHKQPFKTAPAPPLNGMAQPHCPQSGDNHTIGQCLPKPPPDKFPKVVRLPSSIRCVDTSNNDPIVGVTTWSRIKRAGFVCAVFKVNEGTGFIDSWAARQAKDAKAAGLTVSGYDFQHVCLTSPSSEASLFARLLVADGLTGSNTLPGFADTEYPSSTSCNTRSWENTWHATADRLLHRATGTYTGAWWWNPHIGCWWEGSIAWVSGYTSSSTSVPRPCGRSHMDLWQYSDRGSNGVNHTDVSVWMDGAASYIKFTNGKPPAPPKPRLVCFGSRANLKDATCKKVRPEVYHWSLGRDSSKRALAATAKAQKKVGCVHITKTNKTVCHNLAATATTMNSRIHYFDGKVQATLRQYS